MYDLASDRVSPEVIAAIESLRPPLRGPNYDTPEGVLFRKAMGLIEDQRDWTNGHRPDGTSFGRAVIDGRTCRCSAYALYDAGGGYYSTYFGHPLFDALARAMGGTVHQFNATHTHAEVMAKWRECGIANGWL